MRSACDLKNSQDAFGRRVFEGMPVGGKPIKWRNKLRAAFVEGVIEDALSFGFSPDVKVREIGRNKRN
jgi:hypothetical protein